MKRNLYQINLDFIGVETFVYPLSIVDNNCFQIVFFPENNIFFIGYPKTHMIQCERQSKSLGAWKTTTICCNSLSNTKNTVQYTLFTTDDLLTSRHREPCQPPQTYLEIEKRSCKLLRSVQSSKKPKMIHLLLNIYVKFPFGYEGHSVDFPNKITTASRPNKNILWLHFIVHSPLWNY